MTSTPATRRRKLAWRRDDGQLLFTMLAVVAVTGVVMATLTVVNGGLKSVAFDQRFTATAQGADAGAQEAFYEVSKRGTDFTGTSLGSSGPVTSGTTTYTWSATRASSTDLAWSITSTATTGTTTRTVKARVTQSPLFNLAAFADASINFNGNNAAVSFPIAGFGIVGTNGSMTLKGSSTTVDGVNLYDWGTSPSYARCTGQACPPTAQIGTTPTKLDIAQAVGDGGFINDQLAACKAAGSLTAFVGTSIAARDEPYCFTSFFADTQNFTVTGDPTKTARVFVDGGDVTLGNKNHSEVNNDVSGAPNSIRLQIFSTGTTVSMYNQSNLAAAVYAPSAACGGVTSNAATDFYGSMICKTIDNVGGWTFHYDTRLSTIGDGVWKLRSYSEPGT